MIVAQIKSTQYLEPYTETLNFEPNNIINNNIIHDNVHSVFFYEYNFTTGLFRKNDMKKKPNIEIHSHSFWKLIEYLQKKFAAVNWIFRERIKSLLRWVFSLKYRPSYRSSWKANHYYSEIMYYHQYIFLHYIKYNNIFNSIMIVPYEGSKYVYLEKKLSLW